MADTQLDPREVLFAMRNSDWEVVRKFIKESEGGIFLRLTMRNKTIFHFACEYNSLEMIEYLLDKEEQLMDMTDSEDYLGFHYACKKGHYDIVEYLYGKKEKLITRKDKDGWTGYHHACCGGHYKVASYLLSLEPDLLNDKTKRERNGLHYAAMSGNRELVEHLLSVGGQENGPDKDHNTPKDLAKLYNKLEIMKILTNPGELHRNIKLLRSVFRGYLTNPLALIMNTKK